MLSISFLAFYDFQVVTTLLGIDAVEESEYSLSHNRDVSFVLNGDRLFNARIQVNIREEYFSNFIALLVVVWVTTVILLYGVFKNSFWCISVWMFVLWIQLIGLVVLLTCQLNKSIDVDIKLLYFLSIYYLSDSFPCIVLFVYIGQLRQLNKLREEATIAIPCPAPYYAKVALPRKDRIVYNANNGYTHILSNI